MNYFGLYFELYHFYTWANNVNHKLIQDNATNKKFFSKRIPTSLVTLDTVNTGQ